MPRDELPWNNQLLTAVLVLSCACSISDVGLVPPRDGGSPTTGATPACYTGTVDRANWPVAASANACTMVCGPDALGTRTCSQTDLASCQAMGGCVCLLSPCATCTACVLSPLPDCYAPSNAASPPACAATVKNGTPCTPACAKTLCIEADGQTGCICNALGKYACAAWGGGTWK